MPFSKRTLTWNEDVLAGLAVLLLILALVLLWWFKGQPFNTGESPSSLTDEETLQAIQNANAEPNPYSQEEMAKMMAESEFSPSPFTTEEEQNFINMQMPN